MQTSRVLLAGMSGGGKSVFAREIIEDFSGRYHQLVIVNRKEEFADLCEKAYTIRDDGDPAKALDEYSRVFFRVDGRNPTPFLNNLGSEIMKRENVLFVCDEASNFLPLSGAPDELFQVFTGGRSLGHNCIVITQSLKSASVGIDLVVINECTHLVLFRMQGEGNVERVKALFPELGEGVTNLQRPDNGLPPEVAVRNMLTGQAELGVRSVKNPTKRVWRPLDLAKAA